MDEQIFSDKIRLSGLIIEKEFLMIHTYQDVMREARLNSINDCDLWEYPEFILAFQNVAEIFDFLKFTYISKLEPKEQDLLIDIMQRYEEKRKLEIKDLRTAKDYVLKILALSKFHEVVREASETDFIDEES